VHSLPSQLQLPGCLPLPLFLLELFGFCQVELFLSLEIPLQVLFLSPQRLIQSPLLLGCLSSLDLLALLPPFLLLLFVLNKLLLQ